MMRSEARSEAGRARTAARGRGSTRPRRSNFRLACPFRTLRDEETGAPSGIIGALRDISARKAVEDQLATAYKRLEVLAREDGLTGLAN